MPRKDISYLPFRRRCQRRQPALVPHRSFHPRPISAVCLCALSNPYGYYRRYALLLLWFSRTHLPISLPSERFCFPPLSRFSPQRYYGDSDSCAAHHHSAGLPAYCAPPSCRSISNHVGLPDHRLPPRQRDQRVSDFAMNEQARRSTPAESSSLSYGPTVRLRLLPTSLRADAVTFGYGAVAYSDTDFHRADAAPSRAHDTGPRRHDRSLLYLKRYDFRCS